MIHIGLTGGIGSGKSTVARMFGELGATVLDADRSVRELLSKGGAAVGPVAAEFGGGILSPDGSVDRSALAVVVFGSEERRKKLEAILHPLVISGRRSALDEIRGSRGDGVVVVSEAALIFEAGTQGEFDAVLLVTAPEEIRERRLLDAGWPPEQIRDRMVSQWPEARKRPLARWVVDNGGDTASTRAQVEALWREITRSGVAPCPAEQYGGGPEGEG